MDIPSLSMSMSMTKLAEEASVKVMKMGLDDMKESGEGMKKMLEMAVMPNVGGNIDISL